MPELRKVLMTRRKRGDQGIFGDMLVIPAPIFQTGELPYRDIDDDGKSDSEYSSILPGKYLCKWVKSEKRSLKEGKDVFVYQLEGTDNRVAIQIHSGNFCGDKKKGFVSQVEGCILLGENQGQLTTKEGFEQEAILDSKPAVKRFNELMNEEDFELEIVEQFS